MPMDFPDIKSLEMAARVHKFRKLAKGETEEQYSTALADHVAPRDLIESEEIRNKVGWDQFTDKQNEKMILNHLKHHRNKEEPNRKNGEPCSHPGCKNHFTHPCEVCFRIGAMGEYNPTKHNYFI